jgi:hypothetical protein
MLECQKVKIFLFGNYFRVEIMILYTEKTGNYEISGFEQNSRSTVSDIHASILSLQLINKIRKWH